jgi:site-specific recombinase XerD
MNESMENLPLFSYEPGSPDPQTEIATRVHSDTSFRAAINAWGEALESDGRSIHTVKAFTGDMRLVAKFVGGGMAISTIGTHDLKNFLDWMLNKRNVPCSPKTYARRITSIKSFFRWLVETGILAENPASPIPQQSVLSPLPSVLSPSETEAVLKTADAMRRGEKSDARPYTLVNLLLATGIKKGECLGIHLNHVDVHSDEGAILFVRYSDVRKRYKERKLPLPPTWLPAYDEYLTQYKPRERLFPWSPRRLEYLLEEIGVTAKIDKHLSFDMCRWTSALNDYRDGKDKDFIRQKLGISKIQWREVGNKLHRLAAAEDLQSPE